MQGLLTSKFLSRAFLLTVLTATLAWLEGREQEAIYLVIAYVIGDRAVNVTERLTQK